MDKKQLYLLSVLLSDSSAFARARGIIRPDYFVPELRKVVRFACEYFDAHRMVPSSAALHAEATHDFPPLDPVNQPELAYVLLEVEALCKREALIAAVMKSPDLIESNRYGEVEQAIAEAMAVGLPTHLGLSYFEDIDVRLERTTTVTRTSTGLKNLDVELGGGLLRTEILLASANTGGGKSILLANLTRNFAMQHLSVLYISLELSEDLIAARLDAIFTGIPPIEHRAKHDVVAKKLKLAAQCSAHTQIIRMPVGSCARDFDRVIREHIATTNAPPDLLIVDYLDLMAPNESMSRDNVFQRDKASTEQLRELGNTYNMFVATASQQNRGAVTADEVNQSHIAGGMSKANTVDVWLSIIMNPAMAAAGEMAFQLLKTRNSGGVGKKILLNWDASSLRISDTDRSSTTTTEQRHRPTFGHSSSRTPPPDETFELPPPSRLRDPATRLPNQSRTVFDIT